MKQHGSDICFCGDYRSQHTPWCSVCGCTAFTLAWQASDKEREHWKKYHETRAALKGTK